MRRARLWTVLATCTCVGLAFVSGSGEDAHAQATLPTRPPRVRPATRPAPPPQPPPLDAGTAFRTHFGIDLATLLVRDGDPDERLRGIERASALGGSEARALLAQVLAPPSSDVRIAASGPLLGVARRDGRALVAATRGLARELLEEARSQRPATRPTPAAIVTQVGDAGPRHADAGRPDGVRTIALVRSLLSLFAPIDPSRPDLEALARAIAARALALSGDPHAIEALVGHARGDERLRGPAMAALRARAARVGVIDWLTPPLLSAPVVMLAGEVGDLRAIEPSLAAARAADARLREASVLALAELGAPRAADAARVLLKDGEPSVRAAAGNALVKVGAPDAAAVVLLLLADDSTRERAVSLATHVEGPEIDRLLIDLAGRPGDLDVRRAMVVALSHHRSDGAAVGLGKLIADPLLGEDAAGALGRSRARAARGLLEALARDPNKRRLGVRALLLRALVHGVDLDAAIDNARLLATSRDPADRALFIQTHVALGTVSVEHGLAERDAPARVAAIMGALARLDERACHALAARRAIETDPNVRTLLAIALTCKDGMNGVSSTELWARAREGGPDAPLALVGLASRAHDREDGELLSWFGSTEPSIRGHIARGFGASAREDVVGRLARGLLYETDPTVRRTMIRALAERGAHDTPSGRDALATISDWDPEEDIRALADAALRGDMPRPPSSPRETAWLRLATQRGGPGGATLAKVERSDGLAIPVAFDSDGFAVVPGLPPGQIQLVLAPRLPSEQAAPVSAPSGRAAASPSPSPPPSPPPVPKTP